MKTRIELLKEADERSAKAKKLLEEVKALTDKINKEFPPAVSIFMSEKKRMKLMALGPAIDRIKKESQAGSDLRRSFEWQDRAEKERQDKENRKKEDEAQEKRRQKFLEETVTHLISKGFVLGTDFTLYTAISFANNRAYETKVAETVANLVREKAFTSFDGQNCDGPCAGWDGFSNRCECGNRRVGWEMSDYASWKDMQIRGVAW